MGVLASGLLCLNAGYSLRGTDLGRLPRPRRLWEDLSYAIQAYLEARFPAAPASEEGPAVTPETPPDVAWWPLRNMTRRLTARKGIRPWQFLKTLPAKPFLGLRLTHEAEEALREQGRARVLALGFRLLGGISPFLILWLGILVSIPVILWASVELSAAGHSVTGAICVLTFALSKYVVDCLTTQYSAVGFYLVGLLFLVPLAAYGLLGEPPSRRGLWVRCFAAGFGFAACAFCRTATLLVAPGFVLALALASLRMRRTWSSFVIALGLFCLPALLMWRPSRHDIWPTIWEGLADFDSTKGHAWDDAEALAVLKRSGIDPGTDRFYGLLIPASEEFFRRSVLGDIRSDPGWYAAILGRRLLATVRLERTLDLYGNLVADVDVFAIGPFRIQSPLTALLMCPTALLLVLSLARPSALGSTGAGASGPLRLLLCMATAALPVPLLITTGALEARAFVFVYFLGAGFLGQRLPPSNRSERVR